VSTAVLELVLELAATSVLVLAATVPLAVVLEQV
jgi:hypothetical protein